MSEGYDVAQICLNGHVVNSSARTAPQFSTQFCQECGAETITTCQECSAEIRGLYLDGWPRYFRPSFCRSCGKPYPWTEAGAEAARELAMQMDGLDQAEQEALAKSIDDLVADTPRTPVAASTVKRLLGKVGKDVSEGLRKVLVDIASETARKMIWPD